MMMKQLQPVALRRYYRACRDVNPNNESPQCWMAETEIGEAWRAMPLWLRVLLLWRYPVDAWHECRAEVFKGEPG
jgi:hypothetical protein